MAWAPGKVILLGEHAVVYGHPALAGALSQGVHVEAQAGSGRLRVPAWNAVATPGDDTPLGRAYGAILERLLDQPGPLRWPWRIPPGDLVATFQVPAGAGLGSSAALSVALVRALADLARRRVELDQLLAAAMAAETVFHGRASGIDHAVAARGGFGLFTRREGLVPLPSRRPIPLCIGNSGQARDTQGRVARVAELLREAPAATTARFEAIAALVRRAAAAIPAGDLATVGEAMNENQLQLEALEVSCPALERLVAVAREAGAQGAKLTGGGGGGCVIALAPGAEAAVLAAWARAGVQGFITEVGTP